MLTRRSHKSLNFCIGVCRNFLEKQPTPSKFRFLGGSSDEVSCFLCNFLFKGTKITAVLFFSIIYLI